MGETARERFHQKPGERAAQPKAIGTDEQARPLTIAREAARRNAVVERLKLEQRRNALAERITRLGAPVVVDELPDTDEELSELEDFADNQEREARAK
jgi:hypothetical protein